jgi:hypothetical protein
MSVENHIHYLVKMLPEQDAAIVLEDARPGWSEYWVPGEKAMKQILIIGVTVGMFLAGCGAETEKADSPGPSKEQRLEKSQPMEKLEKSTQVEKTVETTESADKYAAEDAAKAAAANHEMTLEDLDKMSGDDAILLGTCQMVKYEQENGEAAMKEWSADFVDEVASAASASDVVSVQEAMIKEGYSCTFQEMNQVAVTGTLGEE